MSGERIMKQFIKTIKKKLAAIQQILKAKRIVASIQMAPDNEARAIICNVLRSKFRITNAEQDLSLNAIADELLAKLKLPQEKPMREELETLVDGIMDQAFWYHGQLAGLTTTWEFKVRIFANKLGIRPNVPVEEKSKRNRANASVEHRSLKDTIKELNKSCGNHLALKLLELCDLRDSIVHCNPNAIRAYATQLFGKNILKPLRGNVVVFSLSASDMKNLSDVKDEVETENQDIVGWFLEVFNSGLPKKAFAAFGESINALELLISFHASCFDDRSDIFRKVVIEGVRPTEEDIAKFRAYFALPYAPKLDADAYFRKIETFLKFEPS